MYRDSQLCLRTLSVGQSVSGGGAGVTGNGSPKGNTLAGAANAGSGVNRVLGWTFATAKTNKPSSTMIRNENMMLRTCTLDSGPWCGESPPHVIIGCDESGRVWTQRLLSEKLRPAGSTAVLVQKAAKEWTDRLPDRPFHSGEPVFC
jgi:hypothetical protein